MVVKPGSKFVIQLLTGEILPANGGLLYILPALPARKQVNDLLDFAALNPTYSLSLQSNGGRKSTLLLINHYIRCVFKKITVKRLVKSN